MAAATQLIDFDYNFEEVNESTAPILAESSLSGSTALVLSSAWSGDTAKAVVLGIKTPSGKYMQVYIAAAGWADTTHATITTRVLKQNSSDITDADTANDFDLPTGSKVYPVTSSFYLRYMAQAIQGVISTGKNVFTLGDATASNNTIKVLDDTGTLGLIRRNDSTNKAQFSNDGSSWVDMDNAGVGVITGGDGITNTSGTIDVDLGTDPGLEFVSNQLEAKVTTGVSKTASGLGVDEAANLNFTGTLQKDSSAVLTQNTLDSAYTDGSFDYLIGYSDYESFGTNDTGVETVTQEGMLVKYDTNTSTNDKVARYTRFPAPDGTSGTEFQFDDFTAGDIVTVQLRLQSLSQTSSFWAFGIKGSNDFGNFGTNDDEAGFTSTNGSIIAVTSNAGSGTSSEAVSGITDTNWNTYKVVFTVGTDAKFYVNGTLKATRTTNLPSGSSTNSLSVGFAIKTTTTAAKSLRVGTDLSVSFNK